MNAAEIEEAGAVQIYNDVYRVGWGDAHAKIDSTVRYLGVDVEDGSELAERAKARADL